MLGSVGKAPFANPPMHKSSPEVSSTFRGYDIVEAFIAMRTSVYATFANCVTVVPESKIVPAPPTRSISNTLEEMLSNFSPTLMPFSFT